METQERMSIMQEVYFAEALLFREALALQTIVGVHLEEVAARRVLLELFLQLRIPIQLRSVSRGVSISVCVMCVCSRGF